MFKVFFLFVCLVATYQRTATFKNTESFQVFSRTKRQTKNYCVLPDHPTNGIIKIIGQEQDAYLPNSNVMLNTIIDLSCGNGTVTETGTLSRAICYQGKWKPTISQMGGCVQKCPQISTKSDTLSVTCKHKSPRINCDNPIEGTVAQVVCKPFYEYEGSPSITCRDGTWDNVISSCRPECGKKRVDVQPLIIGGSTAIKSEFPWVAAVYTNTFLHIGGATVISNRFILSAAHIFVTDDGNITDLNNYIIAAGKYYRDVSDKRDVYMQSSRIERLYVSEYYESNYQNYASDFAIITLKEPFTFSEYVQPVCIDWTNQGESSDLKENNTGVIAGWGYTQAGRSPANVLQKLEVPYISKATCSVPLDFRRKYYTFDKFCAGYNDRNTNACYGDSGGGIFFQNSDSRYYIRGILSVAPTTQGTCDSNVPALYTKISSHLQEIKKETKLTQ